MTPRHWEAPRQVLTLFLIVALVSALALAWLSWQLIIQDRAADLQRRQDALEQAADRAVAGMQVALANLQVQTTLDTAPPAAGLTLVFVAESGAIRARPAGALPFLPVVPEQPGPPASTFVDGEHLEFGARDFAAAMRTYEPGTRAPDVHMRAAALMRLARAARKSRAITDALLAYDRLLELNDVQVHGWPAGLVARLGRMATFQENGRPDEWRGEATRLADDLERTRWPLTQAAFESATEDIHKALGASPIADPIAISRAVALSWLWTNRGERTGRRIVPHPGATAFLMWAARQNGIDVVIADRTYLSTLAGAGMPPNVGWSLSDPDGRLLLGSPPPERGSATRSAVSAGLPWTLHVFSGETAAVRAGPRPALVALVATVSLVLAAGWFFIFRALARERRVAELQSDFVSAVSHEFRSPLTTLGHAADLLAQDRLPSDDLKRQSYAILVRETARLRGLVEGLLDFGRFGSGRAAFQFTALCIEELVRDTVTNFQELAIANGFHIKLSGAEGSTRVMGDREALTRALWNLLDNAVKYSPECRTIWVDMARHAGRFAISVRDQGLGIPADEQQVIFDRFVRGADSLQRRIRGTGIGLAMVRKIAEAHHGDVTVASAPGKGSCFTFTLLIEHTP
jgi:signal transduction histidine kinase